MRPEYVEQEREKKDKKRGMFYSITLHLLLLLLALYPLMDTEKDIEHFPRPIVIQFAGGASEEGAKSAKGGSASQSESLENESSSAAAEEVVPESVAEPVSEPVSQPIAAPQETRPVRTTQNVESIAMPDKKIEAPSKAPVKIEKSNLPTPKPGSSKSGSSEVGSSGLGKSSTASAGAGGNSNAEGPGGQGLGEQGKGKDATGKEGTGSVGSGGIFEGIGDLKRKIVYRPNLKPLVKEEGVIAFDVCVTREGKVTQVVFDRKNSTIRDKESIQKTLDIADKFRFEESKDGLPLECGKLRIRITLDL
jgi:outer membrane biosynthesis protein TonB